MKRFTLRARARSFHDAFRGIEAMLRTQHNAWIHALATVAVVMMGFALRIERVEWLAVVLAIMSVWTAEALNTAFEALCDVASPDFHPRVKRAKDIAAGAVLISSVGAAMIGFVVFVPKLFQRIG